MLGIDTSIVLPFTPESTSPVSFLWPFSPTTLLLVTESSVQPNSGFLETPSAMRSDGEPPSPDSMNNPAAGVSLPSPRGFIALSPMHRLQTPTQSSCTVSVHSDVLIATCESKPGEQREEAEQKPRAHLLSDPCPRRQGPQTVMSEGTEATQLVRAELWTGL